MWEGPTIRLAIHHATHVTSTISSHFLFVGAQQIVPLFRNDPRLLPACDDMHGIRFLP
jgi:hypothetical protein